MGTGYQKYIDVKTAKKYEIPVTYTPSANAKAVAEYTVALILDIVKKITYSNNQVKNREWNKIKTFNLENMSQNGSIIQLYADRAKTVPHYPVTVADAVQVDSTNTLNQVLSEMALSISDLDKYIGKYALQNPIVMASGQVGKAISPLGVVTNKTGYNISNAIQLQEGQLLRIKIGTQADGICSIAEKITAKQKRVIDYSYTFNADGSFHTASAIYNGEEHSYTYSYSQSGVVTITDDSTSKAIKALPLYFVSEPNSYLPLSVDSIPADNYVLFIADRDMTIAVTYHAATADLNIKVARAGLIGQIVSKLKELKSPSLTLSERFTQDIEPLQQNVEDLTHKVSSVADMVGVYGFEWDMSLSSPDVTRIGNMEYHKTLPIQNRMYRHVVDDEGNEVYKLDPNDSTKKEDGTLADLSGGDGQVMVHIPECYVNVEMATATKMRFTSSLLPFYGGIYIPEGEYAAYQASLNRTTMMLSSVCNMSTTYRGGSNTSGWDDTYRSLLGMPSSSISLTNYRTYARNRGSQWNCEEYWMRNIVYWLYVLEYGTLNSQKAIDNTLTAEGYKKGGLGTGVTNINSNKWNCYNSYNPFIKCGTTNSLGNKTGEVLYTMPFEYDACVSVSGTYTMMYKGVFDSTATYATNEHVSDGEDLYISKSDNNTGHDVSDTTYWTKVTRTVTYVNSYRGIEMPFGHIWEWCDGILIDVAANSEPEPVSKAYICYDPSKYSSSSVTNYAYVGNQARGEGYVKELFIGNLPTLITKSFGGSASTYTCDYGYNGNLPSTGKSLRAVYCGGGALNGSRCGFCYLYSYYTASCTDAIIGSRLCFHRKNIVA